jgi:signal peptidase
MAPLTATPPAAHPLRIAPEPRRRTSGAPRRVTGPGRPTSGRAGAVRLVSKLLLFAVVLLILVSLGGMVLGFWRFTVIDTGSMRPTLNPGDVAVLTSEPRADLRRGQIVAFHPPGERLTVVHRVFSIRRLPHGLVIQTKGDANNVLDAWHARLIGNTVWRESTKVPMLGYLTVWSGQRSTRFALLIVIVILLVSTLLGTIWRSSPR